MSDDSSHIKTCNHNSIVFLSWQSYIYGNRKWLISSVTKKLSVMKHHCVKCSSKRLYHLNVSKQKSNIYTNHSCVFSCVCSSSPHLWPVVLPFTNHHFDWFQNALINRNHRKVAGCSAIHFSYTGLPVGGNWWAELCIEWTDCFGLQKSHWLGILPWLLISELTVCSVQSTHFTGYIIAQEHTT